MMRAARLKVIQEIGRAQGMAIREGDAVAVPQLWGAVDALIDAARAEGRAQAEGEYQKAGEALVDRCDRLVDEVGAWRELAEAAIRALRYASDWLERLCKHYDPEDTEDGMPIIAGLRAVLATDAAKLVLSESGGEGLIDGKVPEPYNSLPADAPEGGEGQ